MGGAELAVEGSHMSEITDANKIKFNSDWPAQDSVLYGAPLSSKYLYHAFLLKLA